VLIGCPACATLNRVPAERLGEAPVCGKCKTPLLDGQPVPVTSASFAAAVERTELPVVVDFWAAWCGPCKMVAPVLEQIASERAGKLKIAKVDVDANQALAARFGVQSIPTLLLVRGPIHVDQIAGALPKQALDSWLDRYV
jgi:thioredoxin 2